MLTQVKIIPLLLFVFTLNCGKNQPIQFSGETMGTTYQITIIINSNNKVDAIQLQKKVDSLLTQVNNIFSTYIENSELRQFNDNLSTIPMKIKRNDVNYNLELIECYHFGFHTQIVQFCLQSTVVCRNLLQPVHYNRFYCHVMGLLSALCSLS